jgi:hypothetical protein
MKFPCAFGLLPVLMLCALPAQAKQLSFAIVIGNNAPPEEEVGRLGALHYADDDAVRFYELFRSFAETELLTVPDAATQRRYPELSGIARPPDLETILASVRRIAARVRQAHEAGDQTIVYLAFSGHGAETKNGEPYLALLHGKLTRRVLYEDILAQLGATYTHVFIDACHAGGVVGVRGGDFFGREIDARTSSVVPSALLAMPSDLLRRRFPTVGVVLATSVDQEAHEWSAIESGVFSHELLSGLLGAADINGDHRIEYSELQAFISSANREVDDPRAIPLVVAYPPAINHKVAVIDLDVLGQSAALVGKPGGLGHFSIELANGQRYADAHLAPDAPIYLALPDSGVAFLRSGDREAELDLDVKRRIELPGLSFTARRSEARGSIDRSYRNALFASTYDVGYYKGFVDSVGAVGVDFRSNELATAAPGSHTVARVASISLLTLAASAAATAIVATVKAEQARSDFEQTDLIAPALALNSRYRTFSAVGWISGIGAGVLAILAWWVWPSAE